MTFEEVNMVKGKQEKKAVWSTTGMRRGERKVIRKAASQSGWTSESGEKRNGARHSGTDVESIFVSVRS